MINSLSRRKKLRVLRSPQDGFATLVISLVILMLSTFVVFNVSKAILMEQKITNNDSRAKQAFEAAEAGMNAALSYLNDDPDSDADGCIDPFFDNDNDGTQDSMSTTVGRASVTVELPDLDPICPEMTTSIAITSTGWSDDGTAMRVISQAAATLDPLPNRPDNPLVARGSVTITGSASVYNHEGFSTIWSGNDVVLGGSSGSDTWVPNPNLITGANAYPACMDTPETCVPVKTSLNVGLGLDVIENDDSLGNLSDLEFFMNFFGMAPEAYRASMVTMELTPGQLANVNLATSEVIWIDGDVANFPSYTVGCTEESQGSNRCPITKTKPTIIIIDGDVTFQGTPQIYGLLYVTGQANMSANMTVYGSVVIQGPVVNTTGSLDIIYNSDVLQQTSLAGAIAGGTGTWKDWQD